MTKSTIALHPDNARLKRILEGVTRNPERRLPLIFLLDCSSSMRGEPIAEINDGLKFFLEEIHSCPVALLRTEIAVMSFGP